MLLCRFAALSMLVAVAGCTSERQPTLSEVVGAQSKTYEYDTFGAPLAASTPIESGSDTLLASDTDATTDLSDPEAADANPQVRPGLVKWHATFDDACDASRESGRPVLLFQLMGGLDQRFTCTNGRIARAVLFSDETIARRINL